MTPHEWIVAERRREQRRDAGVAFFGLACALVLLIGGGMLLVALIEGNL